MQTKPLGPQRQLADTSYYLNQLRTKQTDIVAEIASLKAESQQITTDNSAYTQYERKYEVIIKEVRQLEGQLADFNLAVDKIRTNTPVEDIKDMYQVLKRRNEQTRMQVDEIFLRTAEIDTEAEKVREKIQTIHDIAGRKLAELGDEVQAEYQELQEENGMLHQQIHDKRGHFEELEDRIEEAKARLNSDQYKIHQRGLELTRERERLIRQKESLEEETAVVLSPEEMREKLLNKVKSCNAEIEENKKVMANMEEEIDTLNDNVRDKEEEIVNAKKMAAKAKKYEAVYERDRKMQEFIDSFPENKAKHHDNMEKLKATNIALLNHISKNIHHQQNLPNAENLAEMKQELSFKESKMSHSQATLQRLNVDLDRRKDELVKIESLDKKINNELKNLNEKIESMQTEMSNFKSVEQLSAEATETKKMLLKENQRYKVYGKDMNQQVQEMNAEFERLKREISGNETMKRVETLENKLRSISQNVFKLSEYIVSRQRESDYKSIRKETKQVCKDINDFTIAAIKTI